MFEIPSTPCRPSLAIAVTPPPLRAVPRRSAAAQACQSGTTFQVLPRSTATASDESLRGSSGHWSPASYCGGRGSRQPCIWASSSQSSPPCCNWTREEAADSSREHDEEKATTFLRDELPLTPDAHDSSEVAAGVARICRRQMSTQGSSRRLGPVQRHRSRTASTGSSASWSRNASRRRGLKPPHGFGRYADKMVDLTARSVLRHRLARQIDRFRSWLEEVVASAFSPGGDLGVSGLLEPTGWPPPCLPRV